ncbi:MAG: hypothetical protein PHT94_04590 [Candidatus Nanoarchaeia archaeon]|nr:hypothetical protein [Candidatus Nanoarchaeia archaeon]
MDTSVSLNELIERSMKTESFNSDILKRHPEVAKLFGDSLETIVDNEKDIATFNLYNQQGKMAMEMYYDRKKEYDSLLRSGRQEQIESTKKDLISLLRLPEEAIKRNLNLNISKSRKAYSYKDYAKVQAERFELTQDVFDLLDSYSNLELSYKNSQNVIINGKQRKINRKILEPIAKIGENIVSLTNNVAYSNDLNVHYLRLQTNEIIINSLSQSEEIGNQSRIKRSKNDYIKTTIDILRKNPKVFVGRTNSVFRAINYVTDLLEDDHNFPNSRSRMDLARSLEYLSKHYKSYSEVLETFK